MVLGGILENRAGITSTHRFTPQQQAGTGADALRGSEGMAQVHCVMAHLQHMDLFKAFEKEKSSNLYQAQNQRGQEHVKLQTAPKSNAMLKTWKGLQGHGAPLQ